MNTTIITIAGRNGSGKSTAAVRFAQVFRYRHYSAGDFMREIAQSRNITLEELGKIAETDSSVDDEIDGRFESLRSGTDLVIDSRLGFHFIPQSFKVFLDLDDRIAAERMFEDAKKNPKRANEAIQGLVSVDSILEANSRRLANERKRYFEKYGIKNHIDPNHFDIVIDTGAPDCNGKPEVVLQKIVAAYNQWIR